MTRKLKALWLVLAAALIAGALAASGVWAEEEEEVPKRFRAGSSPALVTGVGETTFTFHVGSVKCVTHYEGTMGKMFEAELKITPTYSGCSGFGFSKADVTMEGCYYLFTLEPGTTITGGTPQTTHTTGPMHIKCPEEKSILIEMTLSGEVACTVLISEQTPENIVDTKNENIGAGKTEDVRFTSTLEGIEYNIENSLGSCGVPKPQFDGQIDGEVTVKAFEDEPGGGQISFKITGS